MRALHPGLRHAVPQARAGLLSITSVRSQKKRPAPQPQRRQPSVRSVSGTAEPPPAMDPEVEVIVEKVHATPSRLVLYATGGAAQSVAWLLSVPGASRTILEVGVPYATSALAELLGAPPPTHASAEVAAEMARAAYRRAASLSPFGTAILGVGATCALATDREKRGEHKAFVVAHSGLEERCYELRLAKGTRSRLAEDALASRLVIKAVADATGVGSASLGLGLREAGDQPDELQVHSTSMGRASVLHDLLNGRLDCAEFSGGGVTVNAPRAGRIYLPGSFNPLHDGHRELLEAALRARPGMEGGYELSVGNADKGFLPAEEAERRVAQFVSAGLPLVITQAPLFTQKADLFPGSIFVVGYDTAARLVKPEYYGTETAMLLQFAKLRHQGCSFLVAGRRGPDGRFLTLRDVDVPDVLQRGGLFEELPESEFRVDVSSTELRSRGRGL